jgi:hypothetical protein
MRTRNGTPKMLHKCISISPDDNDFVKLKKINLSKLVREAIEVLKNKNN